MKSGYSIYWTENALNELSDTINYLEKNFTEKEIKKLVKHIENTIVLISRNPDIFPKSEMKNIYKVVILKFNTLYYRTKDEQIQILSFFSNRQSFSKMKIK